MGLSIEDCIKSVGNEVREEVNGNSSGMGSNEEDMERK